MPNLALILTAISLCLRSCAPASSPAVCSSLRFCTSNPHPLHTMAAAPAFTKVPADSLFVSEPDPRWFGNGKNEAGNSDWTNANWLKSRFHFAFAEYRDPSRSNYGVLRVMNDDLVQPARGFGTHPHRNMEIVTYVVAGALTHKDSMGTEETLPAGSIQFMTAGTGVQHSEYNKDTTTPLRFIQMWVTPRSTGLPPNYGSLVGEPASCHAAWRHLVSDVDDKAHDTPIKVNQDVNFHVSQMPKEHEFAFEVREGRQAYLLCVEGSAGRGGAAAGLVQHDGAKLRAGSYSFTAGPDGAHMLVVEMKAE